MFLDADILVVDELTPLLDAIAQHAIVLTPHLLDSLSGPEAVARELNILQSGVCNGGCIAVSQSDSARRFLSWFADRLRTHCCHDRGQGMHFDQRWLDLVPALFDDVHMLRDPGCNVAYWNLPERNVLIGRKRSASLPVFPLQRLRPRPAVHGHQVLAPFHDGDPRSGVRRSSNAMSRCSSRTAINVRTGRACARSVHSQRNYLAFCSSRRLWRPPGVRTLPG